MLLEHSGDGCNGRHLEASVVGYTERRRLFSLESSTGVAPISKGCPKLADDLCTPRDPSSALDTA